MNQELVKVLMDNNKSRDEAITDLLLVAGLISNQWLLIGRTDGHRWAEQASGGDVQRILAYGAPCYGTVVDEWEKLCADKSMGPYIARHQEQLGIKVVDGWATGHPSNPLGYLIEGWLKGIWEYAYKEEAAVEGTTH